MDNTESNTGSESRLITATSVLAALVVIILGILLLTFLVMAKKLKAHKRASRELNYAMNELSGQGGTYEVIDPNMSQCTDGNLISNKEITMSQNEAYAVHKERTFEVQINHN